MNKILPGLYIGDMCSSTHAKLLERNRITHILTLHSCDQEIIDHFRHLKVCCHDTTSDDITEHVTECFEFIHAARLEGGCVLVSSVRGISRSVAMATMYLTTVTGKPWADVLGAIRQQRRFANPNKGFRKQLDKFQVFRVGDEREKLIKKFGVCDAFGDTSLVEGLIRFINF